MSEDKFKDYKDLGIISLTTFYKNGKGVATPIDYRKHEGKLYGSTAKTTYKVKRLRNNPKATIAPCNMMGKLKGDKMDVTVRIMDESEEERGKELVAAIYKKLINRIFSWFDRSERYYLEIS